MRVSHVKLKCRAVQRWAVISKQIPEMSSHGEVGPLNKNDVKHVSMNKQQTCTYPQVTNLSL